MGWKCIAIHWFCIAEKRDEIILQYKIRYCGSRGSGLLNCVATQGRNTGAGARRHALGRARRAADALSTALGARPGRAAGLWAVHLVHSACF